MASPACSGHMVQVQVGPGGSESLAGNPKVKTHGWHFIYSMALKKQGVEYGANGTVRQDCSIPILHL